MNIKLLLSGDGGQGIQTIANLITQAAFENDFYVSDIPNYGLEQRGGISLAFIQISDKEIGYPKFSNPDILLAMSEQAEERIGQYKNENIKILNIEDYKNKLEDNDINKQSYNIFCLGLLGKILEKKKIFEIDLLRSMLRNKLHSKRGWEENKKAFEVGCLIHHRQ